MQVAAGGETRMYKGFTNDRNATSIYAKFLGVRLSSCRFVLGETFSCQLHPSIDPVHRRGLSLILGCENYK